MANPSPNLPLKILAAYSGKIRPLDWRTRIFLWLRWHLTPYFKMASRLPSQGRILDLGAGHGLFSLALAYQFPSREVLGLDHDPERVEIAKEASIGIPNLKIEKGSILAPPSDRFDGIALIDVMHYFPPAEQERIFRQTRENLAENGTLIFREVDPEAGMVSRWNRLYERLATATGFTRSAQKTSLHFRTPAQWQELLGKLGYEVSAERCSSFLFADVLFVAKTRSAAP